MITTTTPAAPRRELDDAAVSERRDAQHIHPDITPKTSHAPQQRQGVAADVHQQPRRSGRRAGPTVRRLGSGTRPAPIGGRRTAHPEPKEAS